MEHSHLAQNTLQHELFHMLQYAYDIHHTKVPKWFWEGQAVWAELKYTKRVSVGKHLTAWFNKPNIGIKYLKRDQKPPNAYSAAPLFAFYDRKGRMYQKANGKAPGELRPMPLMLKEVSKFAGGIADGTVFQGISSAASKFGWANWHELYVDFLLSRFTKFWPKKYGGKLTTVHGNAIIFPNAVDEIGADGEQRLVDIEVYPADELDTQITLRKDRVKCLEIAFITGGRITDISIHVSSSQDDSAEPKDDGLYWGLGFIERGEDYATDYSTIPCKMSQPAIHTPKSQDPDGTVCRAIVVLVGGAPSTTFSVHAEFVGE